jgi:TolB protein
VCEVLVLGASMLMGGAAATAQEVSLEGVESVRRATVLIQVGGAEGSSGSGFILSDDGVIATAAHVLAGASEATVKLANGEEYPVVGLVTVDEKRDMALLRIAGFGLPTVNLGNSDSVEVGQRLLAIGSPLGLESTVSDGLLSGIRLSDGIKVFQISVPVSPGSSGGPIATERGDVVGFVVSGIIDESAQNLNFALPINYLRGYMGIASAQAPTPLAQWEWEGRVVTSAAAASEMSGSVVNDSLVLDWRVLDGVEAFYEEKASGGRRMETRLRYMLSTDAQEREVLERLSEALFKQTGNILSGRKGMDLLEQTDRTVVALDSAEYMTTYLEVEPLQPEIEHLAASGRIMLEAGRLEYDSAGSVVSRSIARGTLPDEDRVWEAREDGDPDGQGRRGLRQGRRHQEDHDGCGLGVVYRRSEPGGATVSPVASARCGSRGHQVREIPRDQLLSRKRAVRNLSVVAACTLGAIGLPTSARSQEPHDELPPTGRIVFTSNRDGDFEIYVMDADGGNQTRLTRSEGSDVEPAWSPDGRLIAFVSERGGNADIYLMNADGSDQRRLVRHPNGDFSPAWSPDGRYIAFDSNREGALDLYATTPDGTELLRITSDPEEVDSYPHWSPDGSEIAFHSTRGDENREIYVVSVSGGEVRRLTENPALEWLPTWSPDGSLLAFWSTREGQWEMYVMEPDGSHQRRLNRAPARMEALRGYAVSRMAWSPDGRFIAFNSFRDGRYDIYVMNADGTSARQLTEGKGHNWDPDWGPGTP